MAKLLIPTKNRPESLGHVLEYMSRFYPGQSVIIADGSTEEYKTHYRNLLYKHKLNLEIDYRPFDEKKSYFERQLIVLKDLKDEFIILGADDDYPELDVLNKGEEFLKNNSDYVSAMGSIVNLYLREDGSIMTRLSFARTIDSKTVKDRARNFSAWSFSTTNAVSRRELLIDRFTKAPTYTVTNFYDFNTGLLDCIKGKIKAMGEPSYFCTRNYRYNYYRPEDNLVYLRQGEDVLRLIDFFRDEFIKSANLSETESQKLASELIRKRIAQMATMRPHRHPGFAKNKLFKSDEVQSQYTYFHDLFKNNTKYRLKMEGKLRFIVETLKLKPLSVDNK